MVQSFLQNKPREKEITHQKRLLNIENEPEVTRRQVGGEIGEGGWAHGEH